MSTDRNAFWTVARELTLAALHHEGLSCTAMAHSLGSTKSAVISRLHKLGYGKPRPAKSHKPSLYEPSGKHVKPVATGRFVMTGSYAPLHLRTGCAFPMNDGGPFLFCNAPVDAHHGYCPAHCAVMFNNYQPDELQVAA